MLCLISMLHYFHWLERNNLWTRETRGKRIIVLSFCSQCSLLKTGDHPRPPKTLFSFSKHLLNRHSRVTEGVLPVAGQKMSRWRPAKKPSWTLVAAVLTAIALAQSTWALDKDGVVEAESAVTELASTIATLYRNKCTVTASCPQSVSAMGRDLTPYLDTVDTRVQDVCLCITTPFFFLPRDLFSPVAVACLVQLDCGNCTGGVRAGMGKSAVTSLVARTRARAQRRLQRTCAGRRASRAR